MWLYIAAPFILLVTVLLFLIVAGKRGGVEEKAETTDKTRLPGMVAADKGGVAEENPEEHDSANNIRKQNGMNKKQRICMAVFLVLAAMTFLNYLLKVVTGIWASGESENAPNFYIYFLDCFGEIGFWGIIAFVLMKVFKDKKE